MYSRPHKLDAGQCAFVNNLAKMVSQHIEGASKPGSLEDAGKGLVSAVLPLNSRGGWVLYITPSELCACPTQASVYKQLELPRSARMQHCSALVDTR